MTDGTNIKDRRKQWLRQVVTKPSLVLKILDVRQWSQRTVVALIMQNVDSAISVRGKKGLFGFRLTSKNDSLTPNATYIPAANRVAVEPTMQVKNYPYLWALGDIAGAKGKDGAALPMVAPVAIQQGKFIAKQIKRISQNKKLEHFKYLDKGSMATIGRNKAVVQVRWFKLAGPLAWLVWLWLHLFYLLGGRNKIGTMADWTWNYLTFDRGNRHIMDSQ